jgi:hypothetical protein
MNAKLRKRSGIAFFVAEDFHVSHHILVYPEFLIRLTLPGRFHMHQNIIDIIYIMAKKQPLPHDRDCLLY